MLSLTRTATALVLSCIACSGPMSISLLDEREITVVSTKEFLRALDPHAFDTVFLSDEFLAFVVDSQLIEELGASVPVLRGRRLEVTASYDVVGGSGILVELDRPQPEGEVVKQSLNFTATSDFGGGLEYHLVPASG